MTAPVPKTKRTPAEIINRLKAPIIIALAFTLVVVLFFVVSDKYAKLLFGFDSGVNRLVELKLSSKDLMDLNDRSLTKWINVKSIEANGAKYKVKIRPLHERSLDFQLNIDDTVYNLFKLTDERETVYNFFKNADKWGLERAYPLVVKLKINAVLIGIYIMEPYVYEQLRDDKGNYFIRLNSDTHRFRKILYSARRGRKKIIKKYFDRKQLAAYFVFFSFFSEDGPLRLDPMVFRFDAKQKKFIPYLTVESILTVLNNLSQPFEPPKGKNKDFFKKLNPDNISYLVERSRDKKYEPLIDLALAGVKKKKKDEGNDP